MTTPTRPPRKAFPPSRLLSRAGRSRRRILSAVATAGLGGLAGCMQLLGSSESRSSDPSSGGSSTTTETDETPVSTTPADPSPTSPTDTDEQSTPEGPMPALQTEGPVNSSPTNDAPYEDPVDGLALTGVTVRVVEERRRDSMHRLDDQLSIGVEDTRFEVRGRGTLSGSATLSGSGRSSSTVATPGCTPRLERSSPAGRRTTRQVGAHGRSRSLSAGDSREVAPTR